LVCAAAAKMGVDDTDGAALVAISSFSTACVLLVMGHFVRVKVCSPAATPRLLF
jgi:hypothetical protein